MQKDKRYISTKFGGKTVADAAAIFGNLISGQEHYPPTYEVSIHNETWEFDSFEEFLAELPRATAYSLRWESRKQGRLRVFFEHGRTLVSVSLPTRQLIEKVFQVFERDAQECLLEPEEEPIRIFIGHGHSPMWRDLKDHLRELHGFEVVAYEVGPRAGLSVKEVLESMLTDSTFAVLVMTGEDVDTYGELHARENVVHEVGLFQGRLGFRRAIVLLEEGCREFSNILGLNQIRFSKGKIRETFGDVVATIQREFYEDED